MSFYNGCYMSFIPEIFIALMAYHAVVLFHTVHGPYSEACALLAAAVACRSYPCQVNRTIVGSSIPVSGRLHYDKSIMLSEREYEQHCANPSGNPDAANGGLLPGGAGGGASVPGNPSNGTMAAAAAAVAGPAQALKHNPGLSIEWAAEEQAILEEGLSKYFGVCLDCRYASESIIVRYAKIAIQLRDKTVRDVALRCRWLTFYFLSQKKENSKRRKEDHNLTRKNKDKKLIECDNSLSINECVIFSLQERVTETSAKSSGHLGTRPNVLPYTPPMLPVDDDDISYKGFLSCVFSLNDMPEIMKQMPPLPVKLNEELANSILPRTTMPM
ncbi:hypothetical protein BHM03_00003908 [Ensete ventricosum]|nr:hypothetical protein BHM03_00003908 [Ensete ventricosum]